MSEELRHQLKIETGSTTTSPLQSCCWNWAVCVTLRRHWESAFAHS